MKLSESLPSLLLAVLVSTLFAVCATSCKSLGSGGGTPLVASVVVYDGAGHVVGVIRHDGNSFVGFMRGGASAELFQKASPSMPNGLPILGPVTLKVGKIVFVNHDLDFKATLDIGDPPPDWVATSGLFRPGELEGLGLVVAPPQP